MSNIIQSIKDISSQIEVLKQEDSDRQSKMLALEEQQSLIVKEWVEANGWGSVSIDSEEFLPYETRDGQYGLRRIRTSNLE